MNNGIFLAKSVTKKLDHNTFLVYHYGFLDGEEHRFEETAYHFRKSIGKIKIENEKALKELRDKFAWYPKCIGCCMECNVYKNIRMILQGIVGYKRV